MKAKRQDVKQENEKILHNLAEEIIREARRASSARFAVMKVRIAEFAKREGISPQMVRELAAEMENPEDPAEIPDSFVEFELRQMIEKNVRNMKGE